MHTVSTIIFTDVRVTGAENLLVRGPLHVFKVIYSCICYKNASSLPFTLLALLARPNSTMSEQAGFHSWITKWIFWLTTRCQIILLAMIHGQNEHSLICILNWVCSMVLAVILTYKSALLQIKIYCLSQTTNVSPMVPESLFVVFHLLLEKKSVPYTRNINCNNLIYVLLKVNQHIKKPLNVWRKEAKKKQVGPKRRKNVQETILLHFFLDFKTQNKL